MLMSLGEFEFDIASAAFQKLKKSIKTGWSKKSRAANYPLWQLTKKEETKLSISGTVFRHYNRGDTESLLEEVSLSSEPLDLVAGTGELLGLWVVTSINFDRSNFMQDGENLKLQFSMEIAQYAP